METQLARLVRAQRLEERLVVLKRRADALPLELTERTAQVSALEAEADQAEAERRSALSSAQELENEVATLEARAAKLERSTETLRDASAAQVARHEAGELRARCAGMQDQALGLLERAEALAQQGLALRERIAGARADLEQFRATVEADASALRAEMDGFAARAAEELGGLDGAVRDHFATVGKRTPGKIVAQLKGDSCGGCGTRLVPNDAVRVKARNAFFRCPSCLRFLVAPEIWSAAEQEGAAGA